MLFITTIEIVSLVMPIIDDVNCHKKNDYDFGDPKGDKGKDRLRCIDDDRSKSYT